MNIRRGLSGKMNLDDSKYQMPPGDYPYAYNVFIGQKDGRAHLVDGNFPVGSTMASGTNVTVGEKETQKKKYYLVWNSNGFHSLRCFTLETRSDARVFENKTDSGGISIMTLSGRKVPSMNVVERGDIEGDIVSFTDGESAPKEFIINKHLTGAYGVVVADNIEAAKDTPPEEPDVEYGDDVARVVNSLRKKLYQFRYRYVYVNNSKSVWSAYSKVALPGGVWSSPDLEMDPTKNNFIEVSVNAGGSTVQGIEICVRQSIGSGWGDIQLSHSVKKADVGLTDFSVYKHKFYGDGGYPFLSQRDQVHLFDYAPRAANAECVINGNVRSYGGILEGYDRVPNSSLDITSSVEMIENGGGEIGVSPWITWVPNPSVPSNGTLTVIGTPSAGWRYRVFGTTGPALADYTSILGDTNNSIATAIAAQQPLYFSAAGPAISVSLPIGQLITYYRTDPPIGGGASPDGGYESTWPWASRFNLPIVYFDGKERTNGAHLAPDAKGATVVTPVYELGVISAKTPEVTISINHTPPAWAVKYAIARSRNLTKESILFWKSPSCTLLDGYFYFDIQNLIDKRAEQSSYVPDYSFADGDRVNVVIGNVGGAQTILNEDYMVVGLVEKDFGTGVKNYVKAKALQASPPTYPGINLIEIWRPASASSADELYYEFGETYPILRVGSARYHGGSFQDQNATDPAKIRLPYGDMYYRKRDDLWIMDKHYSDDYQSAVNSDGRPHVVDYDQREEFFPVRHRHSLEYQGDSTINEMNRFYPDNRDDYDRSLGAICRLISKESSVTVVQEYGIGLVPIFQQVLSSAIGGDVFAQTDRLINRIRYISKERGVGSQWSAYASGPYSDMFIDPTGSKICLVSGGRVIVSSEVNKYQALSSYINQRKNNRMEMHMCYYEKYSRFLLLFNGFQNQYAGTVFAFNSAGELETEITLNGAELIGSMGDLLISYQGGVVWPHDWNRKNEFFASQKVAGVTLLFNDAPFQDKRFRNLSFRSSTPWFADNINTSTGQNSQGPQSYLKKIRDLYHMNFRRDQNLGKGLLSGDRLTGGWMEIRFRPVAAKDETYFEYAEIECEPSKT